MKVKVERVVNTNISTPDGSFESFVSEVYAIDGDRFFVFDEGDEHIASHFKWVDITEHISSSEAPENIEYTVTLQKDGVAG